jgi:hypothetical protein
MIQQAFFNTRLKHSSGCQDGLRIEQAAVHNYLVDGDPFVSGRDQNSCVVWGADRSGCAVRLKVRIAFATAISRPSKETFGWPHGDRYGQ